MDCETLFSGTRKNDSRRLMFQTCSGSFLYFAALKKPQKSDNHWHRIESDKYKYQVYPPPGQMTQEAYETPGTEMSPNVLFPYFVTMLQCWEDSVASAQSICSCWSAFKRALSEIEHICNRQTVQQTIYLLVSGFHSFSSLEKDETSI